MAEKQGFVSNDTDIRVYRPEEIKTCSMLVVDGDETVCQFLKHRLGVKGFQVYTAHDGRQGLRMFEEIWPQLVITDLMLPNIDGYQFIEHIRGRKDWKGKVLVLTGRRLEEDIQKCFALGAADYMTKPFSPVELEARVSRLLAD